MNAKKESYKNILPHFQQPGQECFVTWCIKDAVPPKALERYTGQLEMLRSQINSHVGTAIFNRRNETTRLKIAPPDPVVENLRMQYYSIRKKYMKAYDDLLAQNTDRTIDLNKPELSKIVAETLSFWEGNRLENYAWCIMPNHVHWVFLVKEVDNGGKHVYLQDIMQSVKRQTANKINRIIDRKGKFWQKESFDTTIRDCEHLMNAINYTLNNPVAAGFVKDWRDWPGSWYAGM
jgi:putative transposase